ncbi:MAG: hypothetical protein LBN27_11130 [Prevotellaceae bacterium]|nr:hypothetical protein [Prevotellaceae bacterium]
MTIIIVIVVVVIAAGAFCWWKFGKKADTSKKKPTVGTDNAPTDVTTEEPPTE